MKLLDERLRMIFDSLKLFRTRKLIFLLLIVAISSCNGRIHEKSVVNQIEKEDHSWSLNTTFPQIHTNLNGRVREFVRCMYQEDDGTYWFGTNGDGIIRYDGKALESISIEGISPHIRVLEIVGDQAGNLWFGTSEGLIKYDGEVFTPISGRAGVAAHEEEIWSLAADPGGILWLGSVGGVSQFDGEAFLPFPLPQWMVENPENMLSEKLVFKIVADQTGAIWFATDGNGIFKYYNNEFTHFTTANGLPDNNTADLLADSQGNIWIGTFYGGVSKYDGKSFTNFTEEGVIKGMEAYNLYEDSEGNIWFSAEGFGVYRYDGSKFTHFTTRDGLTTDVVQSIFEDRKGQLWFGTWQGLCIFDGENFMDAKKVEPWTNS